MSTNHVTKVAVFIFILVVGFILRTMYDAGEFKTLESRTIQEIVPQ